MSTFFIYIHLRKHRVYSSSTHGEGLYAKLTLTLLVLFIAGEECATTGAVFIVSTIDSVAPGTIISLSSWCQRFSPSGSLFLVDPTDPRFLFFRYLAKRSLFISVPDINQLSYDLKAYQEGFLRLQELNVTAHREPFSGQAMPTLQVPYRDISEEQVLTLNRKYGITHVITSLNARQLRFNRVYQNEDFVVYSLEGENASESYRETGQV